jgi:plastocyanin
MPGEITQPAIDAIVTAIAERFRPRRIILFGSRARGDHRPDSDIDFLVEMDIEPGVEGRERVRRIHRAFDPYPFAMDIVYTPEEQTDFIINAGRPEPRCSLSTTRRGGTTVATFTSCAIPIRDHMTDYDDARLGFSVTAAFRGGGWANGTFRTTGAATLEWTAGGPMCSAAAAPMTPPPATPSAAAEVPGVAIIDFAFEPRERTVPVGASVAWTNSGNAPHTTTALDGLWDSGTLDPGGTFTVLFDMPGTYAYQCVIHPDMQAIITVRDTTTAHDEDGD